MSNHHIIRRLSPLMRSALENAHDMYAHGLISQGEYYKIRRLAMESSGSRRRKLRAGTISKSGAGKRRRP